MRLGIDLDGVCANWTKGAKVMLNERFNLRLDVEAESVTWDSVMDSVEDKQWKWLWTAGVDRGLFANLDVFPGTNERLFGLQKIGHEIIFMTDRPKAARRDTLLWIAQRLPDIRPQAVVFSNKKWEVDADVYLDDKPENIAGLYEHKRDRRIIIRDRLYNRYFDWPSRVSSWNEFVSCVCLYNASELAKKLAIDELKEKNG